jgi:hypothetical protein
MTTDSGSGGAASGRAADGDDRDRDREDFRRELERRERARAELVRRYERLLAERDERIEELRDSSGEPTPWGRLPSGLSDLFDDRC